MDRMQRCRIDETVGTSYLLPEKTDASRSRARQRATRLNHSQNIKWRVSVGKH